MYQLHERPIEGKVSIIAPTIGLTAADIQKTDLLLASLYDAGQYAERVAMKTLLRQLCAGSSSPTIPQLAGSQISVCSTTFFERNFPMRRFDDRLTIK